MQTGHTPRRFTIAGWAIFALAGAICFLLAGCGRGFIPDQTLKDRFSRNRADFDELVRLFKSQTEDEIGVGHFDSSPQKPPADPVTWKKIHDLLVKLDVKSISGDRGQITIFVQIADADLLRGRYYYFVYNPSAPGNLIPSLEKEWPYKPGGGYTMRLDGNWYVSMNEDE